MEEILNSFRQVAGLVSEITNASREQSSGIEQVTQAIAQMDEVTQQNAALVEEAAAAAESLEDQTRVLAQAVSVFRMPSHRPSAAEVPPPPAAAKARPQAAPIKKSVVQMPTKASRSSLKRVSAVPAAGDDDEWEEF
ncbi:hypothetical protein [Thiorhodococcus minor]|uniref:hypothetical protein n=1 Tax=Thiorhodococcus minor TaxID=57489 RepID=UPI003CC90D70